MTQRIVIRHLGGSKAQRVEEFPLDGLKELVIGRDPSAALKYDPHMDDLVSRTHAKIVRDPEETITFTVIDQNSSNGTYLNKRRLAGPAKIAPGDIIQLGPGGPEFQFDLDPRPQELLRHTRVATDEEVSTLHSTPFPSTRIDDVPPPPPSSNSAGSMPPAIGRATIERLIEAGKSDTRKYLVNGGAALLGVIILVVGLFLYKERTTRHTIAAIQGQVTQTIEQATKPDPTLTAIKEIIAPEDIAKTYGSSTVFLESGWKLIDTSTGKQLFHLHIPTKKGCLPAYLLLSNGNIEPRLVTENGKCVNPPIGGSGLSGSGFVVTQDGFVLTNRHVAAPWETQWGGTQPPLPGILYQPIIKKRNLEFVEVGMLTEDSPYVSSLRNWVPAKSLGGKPESGKYVEGRHDYFDVTFAKTQSRIPGRLVRVSDSADVALVKIDMPQSLTKVEMLDSYDSIAAGKVVTVLGYPGVAPSISVRVKSQDTFNREDHWKAVPDPTVTTGSLGRIIRGEATPTGGTVYDYRSEVGDLYQLTINATGPGNSGGPVFDDHGKVVGVFSAVSSDNAGTRISFAVPIKYGMELMGLKAVLR